MGGYDSQKLRPLEGNDTPLRGAAESGSVAKAAGAIDEVLLAAQILDFATDPMCLFSKTDPCSRQQQRKCDQRSRGFLKSRVPWRVYSQPLCDFDCRAAPPAGNHAGEQQEQSQSDFQHPLSLPREFRPQKVDA